MEELSPSNRKRPLSIAPCYRDCRDLCANGRTVRCALEGCIPCGYKIALFDVALDTFFCKTIPNQRPELCPRNQSSVAATGGVLGYNKSVTVLTIGDGDMSFSLALSRMGCRVVATSYESKATLLRVYQSVGIQDTLRELERNARVYYEVDATDLEAKLKHVEPRTFDRLVWNFPCAAIRNGRDGQNQEMEDNKRLLRQFCASCKPFLKPDGQLHLNHKTKPPFNQWKIENVVDFPFVGRVVLDRHLFPPYIPRKALDRKSFPCHDACTYIFGSGGKLEHVSLDDFQQRCVKPEAVLVKVNEALIDTLRTTFLCLRRSKTKRKKKRRPNW